MDFSKVKTCKIYPSIGIARLGNSPAEFFIAPELPGVTVEPEGGYKDRAGLIKRQGARFRVYAFDAAGQVLGECRLDEPGVDIVWTVNLANKKAAWHEFQGVEAGLNTDSGKKPTPLRNKGAADRSQLEILPLPCTVSGVLQRGPKYQFDDGMYQGINVPLGELQTDTFGRLIVLGGFGKSGHTDNAKPITHYANNDGWFDDASDGSVNAEVTLAGTKVPVSGAWVIVAPPDFSPFTDNIVTLYEVMKEASSGAKPPSKLSFVQDVYPIFKRQNGYQWVNEMALRGHGPDKNGNFLADDVLKRLRDNSASNQAFRQSIFARIRSPRTKSQSQANYNFMPLLSGDEGDCEEGRPDTWLYLLETQYAILEQWAQGKFQDDWPPPRPITDFDSIPLADQPGALNFASLSRCVGGPFFPGIEITYIARDKKLYSEPFRFDASAIKPGDITKRMAVPWQADFYECQIHWWPGQRPDYVLNEEEFQAANSLFPYDAKDTTLNVALLKRLNWDRGVGQRLRFDDDDESDALPGDNDMVSKWASLGFVAPRKTDAGEVLLVETGRSRYDGLSDREYYYMMLNLDSYPDFRPKAKQLAQQFLDDAWTLIETPAPDGGVDDYLRFFPYSERALAERLEEIYAILLRDKQNAERQDPKDFTNPENPRSREEVIERIRQLAPFNQLDGVWLRNISQAGPIDEINSFLFSIWMDEAGDGNPDQNHANLYTKLLGSLGITMPPVNSREYVDNPDLLDSAFTAAVFELVISEFTRTFFPEILGMTLQLEWEVLNLWPGIVRQEAWGIDTHFYRMHVGIDNASNGHGAKARHAVAMYLDRVRQQTGSEDEVQKQWKRIWNGFAAFETLGTLSEDLRDLLLSRRDGTPESDLIDLVNRKRAYGRLNHGDKRIQSELINDLFEDPQLLLDKLSSDKNYITPGDPGNSGFFQKLTFDGPMYKVFTDDEIEVWRRWVVWLGSKPQAQPHAPAPQPPAQPPQPSAQGPAQLMAALIAALKDQQLGDAAHQRFTLKGPDPTNPGQQITQPVAWWFDQPIPSFMQALADPANGWVTPGNPSQSRFLTQLVDGNNAMADAYNQQAPGLSRTWKDIATDWIRQGCPIPSPAKTETFALALALPFPPKSKKAFRLGIYASPSERARHPRGKVLGMGTVH
ncbi:MAG TPA: LodA/GoxA family CTQ-dependent oxidase [Bryobacteraceae bacterium]|nr:LodA/GoxA family CTQ-dependent oxidase [Bryobacteraceae bacterium]